MPNNILVTDGQNKNALAVLRSLGNDEEKYSIDITTNFPRIMTLSSYSRYCRKTNVLKTGNENIDLYAEELLSIVNKGDYDALIPVGLKTYMAVSKYSKEFNELTGVAVPDWEKMQVAFNKEMTMKFSDTIGVPTPKTMTIITEKDLDYIDKFPVVIKSSDGFLKYSNNKIELYKNFKFIRSKSKSGIIVQEYIRGFGCGFYGVYNNGRLIAHFLHKRLNEFPITGGASAFAESYFDEKLFVYGKKLCDDLKWHGPIMAEFKYDVENNEYKLIELNPKLWGSLDLTIAAGVNIPKILLQIALGKELDIVSTYRYVKYKWLFPDEFKVLASNFSFSALKEFLILPKDIKTNFILDDPLPTSIQIFKGLWDGLGISVNETKKYPHGRILE